MLASDMQYARSMQRMLQKVNEKQCLNFLIYFSLVLLKIDDIIKLYFFMGCDIFLSEKNSVGF